MKRKHSTDDTSDEPSRKKPKWDIPEDLKLETVARRVTRSSKSQRKELLGTEERENIMEQVNPSVRKSKRLTNKKEFERKEQTCTVKSLDASLLRGLSNGDLTGILIILKAAKLGKCSFTQSTLDNALLSASRQGFLFVMQTLLYLGANIESSDRDGNTALILSVERKSVEMVEFLLKKGANAKAVRKSTGDSCLLLAVQPEGLFQIFKLLIDHGSNIHSQNKNGDTALIRAFKFGNVRIVHSLMKNGADADWRNKFGKTARAMAKSVGLSYLLTSMSSLKEGVPALVKAVKMKDVQLLEILLDNKVENVNAFYWEKNVSTTALELAFQKIGFKPLLDPATNKIFETMIDMLLKEGADVNRNSNTNNSHDLVNTPLFAAVAGGLCDKIDLLIQYGASRLSKAFRFALALGNVECAGLLLDKGAEGNFMKLALRVVSTKEVDSFRFLHDKCQVVASDPRLIHTAVRGGHINMVRLLVELGADVNARCSGYSPVLHHVKDMAMATFLVDNGADLNAVKCNFSIFDFHELPLTVAIKESRTDLVKFYLSRGANILHSVGNRGFPVLQCLCDNPSAEMLDLFLAEGVNIDTRDVDGESTLMWAVKREKLELLKLLINKGADVNLANNNGVSPLMQAVTLERFNDGVSDAIIECLMNSGADVNRLDLCGNSALIHCAKSSESNVNRIKLLVEAGASVNIQNQDKMTALSVSYSFEFERVKIFIEAGADVNIPDRCGNTPLMNSVRRDSTTIEKKCIQLFLDHGADVNFVNTKGHKPVTALSISFYKWIQERSCRHLRPSNDGIINLLEAGADPNLTPYTRSLLHWAILFNQRSVIPILVVSGLSPCECDDVALRGNYRLPSSDYHLYGFQVSPFMLALYLGRLSIAKYLADLSFFTEEDIGQGYRGYDWAEDLQDHLRSKGYVQTLAYVDEFTSGPRSLTDLCSIFISGRLERSSDRKRAVMSIELPVSLQHRLLYQHTGGRLGSGIDETKESEQYNLTARYDESESESEIESESESDDDFF